jgi:UDP:flavonoid glycosyltransferase YjiC (YdhE family)
MRVLFIPLAAASHYYPMVPSAWAFRAAGHEVVFAAHPSVTGAVVSSGMMAVPVGGSYDLLARLGTAHTALKEGTGRTLADFRDTASIPEEVRREFIAMRRDAHARSAVAMADELVAFAREWRPDVVVSDVVALAGPLLAELLGVPLVYQAWGPQHASLARFPGHGAAIDTWPAELRALYERFEVPARERYGVGCVDPCPPSLQSTRLADQIVARFVPYNGSAEVPEWLRRPAERPRVGVSWSVSNSTTLGAQDSALGTVITSLAGLDVDVVVTVNSPDLAGLGEIPSGVRVVENLPLQLMAPTCSVAVNHGGAGTMLTYASYGIPQVLLPQEPGQRLNSDLLAAAGAGVVFGGSHVNAADVTCAVSSMLGDARWHKAAEELRQENLAQDTPTQVVRTIEGLKA